MLQWISDTGFWGTLTIFLMINAIESEHKLFWTLPFILGWSPLSLEMAWTTPGGLNNCFFYHLKMEKNYLRYYMGFVSFTIGQKELFPVCVLTGASSDCYPPFKEPVIPRVTLCLSPSLLMSRYQWFLLFSNRGFWKQSYEKQNFDITN